MKISGLEIIQEESSNATLSSYAASATLREIKSSGNKEVPPELDQSLLVNNEESKNEQKKSKLFLDIFRKSIEESLT